MSQEQLRKRSPLEKGDYVLATKYEDGDPYDGWALGFYDGPADFDPARRHMVVDGDGKPHRRNGFRRVERVSVELGNWIAENAVIIAARTRVSPINMWRFKYSGETARNELLLSAGSFTAQIAQVQGESDTIREFVARQAATARATDV